jgi:hypothetical protein
MCDQLVLAVPSRAAKQGEALVAYRFPIGCVGLAAAGDVKRLAGAAKDGQGGVWRALRDLMDPLRGEPVCAVWPQPGARLRLYDIPVRLQLEMGVGAAEDVTFTRATCAENVHRDAVRFANGSEIQLEDLEEGQRLRVLDLSLAEKRGVEAARVDRLEYAYRVR